MNTKTLSVLIAAVLILVGAFFLARYYRAKNVRPTATVVYACNSGAAVGASFYPGDGVRIASSGMPLPSGYVVLAFSDGRTMTLHQSVSADGARYVNADESFVFWSKGNSALVLENNVEKSYTGCVAVSDIHKDSLPFVYHSSTYLFTLRYPKGFTKDESYVYEARGPEHRIPGVIFTIDPQLAAGTNLSRDSYVSVEKVSQETGQCTATTFAQEGAVARTISDGGVDYSFASTSDAAVGNRYDESVFAFPTMDGCMAVRYFIHYGAIQNYPGGAVREFDEAALVRLFDTMRHTLIVGQ